MKDTESISLLSLPPLLRAKQLKKLIEKENLTVTEIAKKINKSIPFVSNTLRLLKLPEMIKDGLESLVITEGHARALGAVKEEKVIIEIYKKILIEGISVRHTEKLTREAGKRH